MENVGQPQDLKIKKQIVGAQVVPIKKLNKTTQRLTVNLILEKKRLNVSLKPKVFHRICSDRKCGKQFICHGECGNNYSDGYAIATKNYCYCPECAKRQNFPKPNTKGRCESRFGKTKGVVHLIGNQV